MLWYIALTASVWFSHPTENLAEGFIIPLDKPNTTYFCICPSKQRKDHVYVKLNINIVFHSTWNPYCSSIIVIIIIFLSFPPCRFVPCVFRSRNSCFMRVHLQELCSVFSRPWRQFGGDREKPEHTGHRCHLQVCAKKIQLALKLVLLTFQLSTVVAGSQISFLVQYWTKPTPIFPS